MWPGEIWDYLPEKNKKGLIIDQPFLLLPDNGIHELAVKHQPAQTQWQYPGLNLYT